MSIQTELTRLTNAKAAIQTAIEGKGVTVPSGTLLDGMAALIEGIEAGGGGGEIFGSNYFQSGSFTLSAPAANYTITHNLGRIPQYMLIFLGAEQSYSRRNNLLIFAAKYISTVGDCSACVYGKTSSSNAAHYFSSSGYDLTVKSDDANALWYYTRPMYDATEEYISVGDATGDNIYYLLDGRPYYWIVW